VTMVLPAPERKGSMACRLIVLAGCAGSGKSTYARQYFPDALVVSADHYFEGIAARACKTYSEVWDLFQQGTAHARCRERFAEAIAAAQPVVIVDNTNVRPSDRQRFVKLALEQGYEVEIHVLSPCPHGTAPLTPEEASAYVSLCHERNIHGVPLDVIANQFSRLDLPSGVYRAGKPPEFIRPCLIARETGHDET